MHEYEDDADLCSETLSEDQHLTLNMLMWNLRIIQEASCEVVVIRNTVTDHVKGMQRVFFSLFFFFFLQRIYKMTFAASNISCNME